MFARAIAEFEFSLTFANAPIDRYARGSLDGLDDQGRRGAILFFGAAGCSSCHGVGGESNEMFTDFRTHAIGVPQLVPRVTNNQFDGPDANEDFGRAEITGDPADRYAFRTPSLRNVAEEAAFMHDGAFTSLREAIPHHLDVKASALAYDPGAQGLPDDLSGPTGPLDPVLAPVDRLLAHPIELTPGELDDLVAFVARALVDPRSRPERLRHLVPQTLPSGRRPLEFEFGP